MASMKHVNDYEVVKEENGHTFVKAPQFVWLVCLRCGAVMPKRGKIPRCRIPMDGSKPKPGPKPNKPKEQ